MGQGEPSPVCPNLAGSFLEKDQMPKKSNFHYMVFSAPTTDSGSIEEDLPIHPNEKK
jgi:hypothetical protein